MINHSPHLSLEFKTLIEVWSGASIDYSNLKVFGYLSYMHMKDEKLNPRARKCIFLGYGSGVKGHRLWGPNSKKVVTSRDVMFDEFSMFSSHEKVSHSASGYEGAKINVKFEHVDIVPEESPLQSSEADGSRRDTW